MSAKQLTILEYPAPSLMEPSEPVDPSEIEGLQGFIDDMMYTMFFHEGVGLAAPQVGRNIRLFIIDQKPVNGNKKGEPWVFINPVIEEVGEHRLFRPEGCLSFPGQLAEVDRPDWVKVTALDRHGEEFTMDTTYNHLFSIAVQHEYDHLEGTLLTERARKRDQRKLERWAVSRA
jgi:peptide deformylase